MVLLDDIYVWCKEVLKSLDHQRNSAPSKFFLQFCHFLVSILYRQLRIKARDHIKSGTAPMLSLAPKLDTAAQWQVR